MAIDISGLNFFMPVFLFLLAFIILYAILAKTKILGENNYILLFVSFILTSVFMSVSSLKLYLGTIIPWMVIMVVIVFLLLVLAGISFKKLDDVMSKRFSWAFLIILIVIFAIAAIYVFNPVLDPDLIVASGSGDTSLMDQLRDYFGGSTVAGTILLIIVAAVVAWVITKKAKK
jgi:hypothetical protein